jgi:DNA polymerase III delta prime subunit
MDMVSLHTADTLEGQQYSMAMMTHQLRIFGCELLDSGATSGGGGSGGQSDGKDGSSDEGICLLSESSSVINHEIAADVLLVRIRPRSVDNNDNNAEMCVCLKAILVDSVNEEDIVVPPWVMSALNQADGAQVTCEHLATISSATDANNAMILKFVGYRTARHWDEAEEIHLMNQSAATWPASLPADSFDLMVSRLRLSNGKQLFHHRQMLGFSVADHELLFEVKFLIPEASPFRAKWSSVQFEFDLQSQTNTENAVSAANCSSSSLFTGVNLLAWQHTLRRMDIALEIAPVHSHLFSSNSLLLSGPEGSGKSALLRLLCSQLVQMHLKDLNKDADDGSHISSSFVTTIMSALSIVGHDASKLPVFDKIEGMTATELVAELETLCNATRYHSNSSSDSMFPITIVVIEDLDCVFGFDEVNNDDSGSLDIGIVSSEIMMVVSALLSRLLVLITQKTSDSMTMIPVYVLGSCRRSLTDIPRKCQGYPEFETMVAMPRISFVDRFQLLSYELGKFKELSIEPFADTDDGVSHDFAANMDGTSLSDGQLRKWAYKLSGLTAGYTPGDLILLFRKIVSMHHNNDSRGQPGIRLSWPLTLTVLANFTPRSLQGVVGRTTVGSSSSGMTWDSFGGYDLVKKQLKRVIATMFHGLGSRNRTYTNRLLQSVQGKSGIVLHGPSGCGKTFLAGIIANEVRKMIFLNKLEGNFVIRVAVGNKPGVYKGNGTIIEVLRTDGSHHPTTFSASPGSISLFVAFRRL